LQPPPITVCGMPFSVHPVTVPVVSYTSFPPLAHPAVAIEYVVPLSVQLTTLPRVSRVVEPALQ
jgi:hypothetical protein